MRRSRRLTSAERWELGLFLALLIVTCLCLTALLNLNGLPRLFATGSATLAAETLEPAPAIQELTPTIETATPANPAPLAFQEGSLPVPAEQAALTAAAQPPRPVPAKAAPKPPAPAKPKPDIKIYKGEKYRYVKTVTLRVTAYAPDPRCTWPYPGTTTASGLSVKTNGGKLVAADPNLIPLHSLVVVPGYAGGNPVPVLDTGGAIKGRRLDVLLPTFEVAKQWGSKNLEVKVYEPVDD
jgi:3D (Asp-Asp-Asp) domain-containing protein